MATCWPGLENNLWLSINSPGRMVPRYLRAGRAAKVLARAISNTMKILEWIWITKISDPFNTTVRHVFPEMSTDQDQGC